MNYELLARLALLRRDDALRAANDRRRLHANRPRRRRTRLLAARAIRAVGYAALTAGDAIAGLP